jgi:putative transposase
VAAAALDDVYPVVFLDALVLRIREGGSVQRRACYLALGVTVEGERDVLGMWFEETEGAKFWMQVPIELKERGVSDILLCCVDGWKGLPVAIEAIYPSTVVQTCVVQLVQAQPQVSMIRPCRHELLVAHERVRAPVRPGQPRHRDSGARRT